jgi:hypothetical protein
MVVVLVVKGRNTNSSKTDLQIAGISFSISTAMKPTVDNGSTLHLHEYDNTIISVNSFIKSLKAPAEDEFYGEWRLASDNYLFYKYSLGLQMTATVSLQRYFSIDGKESYWSGGGYNGRISRVGQSSTVVISTGEKSKEAISFEVGVSHLSIRCRNKSSWENDREISFSIIVHKHIKTKYDFYTDISADHLPIWDAPTPTGKYDSTFSWDDEEIKLPATNPQKDGKTFVRWEEYPHRLNTYIAVWEET